MWLDCNLFLYEIMSCIRSFGKPDALHSHFRFHISPRVFNHHRLMFLGAPASLGAPCGQRPPLLNLWVPPVPDAWERSVFRKWKHKVPSDNKDTCRTLDVQKIYIERVSYFLGVNVTDPKTHQSVSQNKNLNQTNMHSYLAQFHFAKLWENKGEKHITVSSANDVPANLTCHTIVITFVYHKWIALNACNFKNFSKFKWVMGDYRTCIEIVNIF